MTAQNDGGMRHIAHEMVVKFEDVLFMKNFRGTWSNAMSMAVRTAVGQTKSLLIVQPGVIMSPESEKILIDHIVKERMICAPTIVNHDNSAIELTHNLVSGYPDMKWAMGTHDATKGPEQVVCFDHGVIGIPIEALIEVGNFDRGFNEYFAICDWTARARWHGYPVYLCHDAPVTVPNQQMYSEVFRGREEVAALLDREHFERKWGGVVMRNLST